MGKFVNVLLFVLPQLLDSLGSVLLLDSNSAMHLCQLCLLLLHGSKALQNAHNTEFVCV